MKKVLSAGFGKLNLRALETVSGVLFVIELAGGFETSGSDQQTGLLKF
jgi:hypothetical protein